MGAVEGDVSVIPTSRRYKLGIRSDTDPRAVRKNGTAIAWEREASFVVVDLGSGASEVQIDW